MIGWLGVICGLAVGPFQLYKIIRTGKTTGISLPTYVTLCLAMTFYLIHAIQINDAVFITAQSSNLVVNSIILILLVRDGKY
jgi:uncharacterized protein with PQ loop repeat